MLAICSRNDAESVERVFRERAPELALARTDFVAARIGWGPKSQHLAALARSLGVSLDSFILVDDDPFVCAEVRVSLPEVSVVHLPIDEDGAARLRLTPELDHFFVTDEDRTRTDSYRGDALRAHEAGQVTSVADLNHKLETSIEVLPADRRHWPRIEQLIARTNQFTSGTLQPGDVRAALIGGAQAWVVAVRDRFGDYGVVAAAITGSHPEALVVEGLAMSCRVLNRGVDDALVDHLQEAARQAGLREVRARLIDRGRNRLARDFLAGRAWLVRREGDEETYVMRCDGEEKIGAPAEVRAALQAEAAQ
jgi:FkbH-like protein